MPVRSKGEHPTSSNSPEVIEVRQMRLGAVVRIRLAASRSTHLDERGRSQHYPWRYEVCGRVVMAAYHIGSSSNRDHTVCSIEYEGE